MPGRRRTGSRAFEHLDIAGGIAGFGAGAARGDLEGGPAFRLGSAEQVIYGLVLALDFNDLDMSLHVLRADVAANRFP